jgi:hypothetical protein
MASSQEAVRIWQIAVLLPGCVEDRNEGERATCMGAWARGWVDSRMGGLVGGFVGFSDGDRAQRAQRTGRAVRADPGKTRVARTASTRLRLGFRCGDSSSSDEGHPSGPLRAA